MKKTVVINVVGLSRSVIGPDTPFISNYIKQNNSCNITPMLPAVTTSVQSTYLTGKWPSETGIVGNGWYDHEDAEIKFWKQSNKLVQSDKIWDKAKAQNNKFTCANMFWWYNMYSNADYSVTPRPNYLADGRKLPDCYSQPAELRDILQERLGQFPLFQFWGPGANIKSSQWIAEASMITDELYDPTLTLIYLPHLDYCLQKFGADVSKYRTDLGEIDKLVEKLALYYQARNTEIIILSEYGIAPVNNSLAINRILRKAGLLQIRIENGLEILDAGASKAFAVADHQIAHIYLNQDDLFDEVKQLLKGIEGIDLILDKKEQKKYNIDHKRSGDLVLVAKDGFWFNYYFWLDDKVAPDYARCVDIHKKPGYDPVEMFMSSKARAGYKLLRKKLALRYVMDVIPLDASLVKGSHGNLTNDKKFHPVLISNNKELADDISATQVFDVVWSTLFETDQKDNHKQTT